MKYAIIFLLFFTTFLTRAQEISQLQELANNGNSDSQYELACYYASYSNDYDFELALKYLRESIKGGNEKANEKLLKLTSKGYEGWGEYSLTPFYDLGICDYSSQKELLELISNGYIGPAVILAHSYFNQGNYENAIKYYSFVIENISLENSKLGYIDHVEMIMEYVLMDAITRIAYCYENGLGVKKDLPLALTYYSLLGNYVSDSNICSKIQQVLNKYKNLRNIIGECGEQYYDLFVPNPQVIRPWDKIGVIYIKLGDYSRASDALAEYLGLQGNSARTLWIGEMYYKGLGRPQNYDEAFKCFNFLATEAQGAWGYDFNVIYPDLYADACYRLYECYAHGRGTEINSSKARYFFREALRYGSSSALYDDQKKYEVLNF